jgi:hypothetical protein
MLLATAIILAICVIIMPCPYNIIYIIHVYIYIISTRRHSYEMFMEDI